MLSVLLAVAVLPQLIIAAVSIGLAAASYFLLQKKADLPIKRDGPTTLTERGSSIPYVFGRRRVGALVGWVGDRFYKMVLAGGDAGKGPAAKKPPKVPLYVERAWHILCVGPASKLHNIWVNGKLVWSGPITPGDTPSGSSVNVNRGHLVGNGNFTIYWGEHNQPIDPLLSDSTRVGIASRWPYLCYVVWNMTLGSSPHWPVVEYEIETTFNTGLVCSGPSDVLGGLDIYGDINGVHVEGPNPGRILYVLLFGNFPWGLALDRTLTDDPQSWTDLETPLKNEKLAASIVASEGDDALAVIASICQDCGILLPWDPTKFKFIPTLIRQAGGGVPSIDGNLVCDPLPEIENTLAPRAIDEMVFAYFDRERAYKQSTIGISADGQATLLASKRSKKIDIRAFTQFETAQIVAERRSQEELAGATRFQITLNRSTIKFYPGMVLYVPSVTQQLLRVGAVHVEDVRSEKVKLDAITDFYGASVTSFMQNKPPVTLPTFETMPDTFTFFEPPPYFTEDITTTTPVIAVPRIRSNGATRSSDLWLSHSNVSYEDEIPASTKLATGGISLSTLPAGGSHYLPQGPTFTAVGPDISQALDLSSDADAWRAGKQMALILTDGSDVLDGELCFVKKITAIGGSTYRLDGLLRARCGTPMLAHALGSKIFVFQIDQVDNFTDPSRLRYEPGAKPWLLPIDPIGRYWVKSQPTGITSTYPLDSITGIKQVVDGRSFRALAPLNLRTTAARGYSPFYKTGQDVPLRWDYQAVGPRTGAGMFNAGDAIGAFAAGPHQDTSISVTGFWLFILTDDGTDTEKARVQGIQALNYTITNAALVAAFGAEPASFKARLYAYDRIRGLSALCADLVVTKV